MAFTAKKHAGRTAKLRSWALAAMLFQVAAGAGLLATIDGPLGSAALVSLTLGAAVVATVIWVLRAPDAEEPDEGLRSRDSRFPLAAPRLAQLFVLLPVLFVAMLAGRQLLQDQALEGQRAAALVERTARAAVLTVMQPQAMAEFTTKLETVYDNGKTIYTGSCQPCHGPNGTGDGPAARRLLIPAEDLSSIRVERAYVHSMLTDRVPGSAMPYFTVFDRPKLERLMDELDNRFGMLAKPSHPAAVPGDKARHLWEGTCAECHAQSGAVSAFGKTLKPEPPDLTLYELTAERALAVITEGYPGTVMQPYRDLPEQVRRDLGTICQSLRAR